MKEINHGDFPRSIAIVSGKGGSGKTMIAALMASIFSKNGILTTLVDGDIGTGGLTYYLGLKKVENISLGLSNVLFSNAKDESTLFIESKKWLQPVKKEDGFNFVGIGDHRRLFREHQKIDFSEAMKKFFDGVNHLSELIIVDCRGGIDPDSLDICKAVDEVIIVVETDTTSYQATQYLVDVLYENNLAHKMKGFIVNKAFDDPSSIARNGTASFRTQYLGAIPFDLAATRKFLVGEFPSLESTFGNQLWLSLKKAYGERIKTPKRRPLEFSEFKEITLTNVDSQRGGLVLSSIVIIVFMMFQVGVIANDSNIIGQFSSITGVMSILMLALAASLEPIRKSIGRAFSIYIDLLKKVMDRER